MMDFFSRTISNNKKQTCFFFPKQTNGSIEIFISDQIQVIVLHLLPTVFLQQSFLFFFFDTDHERFILQKNRLTVTNVFGHWYPRCCCLGMSFGFPSWKSNCQYLFWISRTICFGRSHLDSFVYKEVNNPCDREKKNIYMLSKKSKRKIGRMVTIIERFL